ncbi:MAG: fibronectin type III domain protein [Parcubacteria group bacterium GW2011_GWA2_39_18]|nr:MAG: fibronectin type III domain protein [Parcubacteria group bacterium GW2011_GWA2_39_18]
MRQLLVFLIFFFLIIALALVALAVVFPSFLSGLGSLGGAKGLTVSFDGGNNWQGRNAILNSKTTLSRYKIYDLFFDNQNSDTIYALTDDGIYKSTNQAELWFRIGEKDIPSSAKIDSLIFDQSNSQRIFVSIFNKNSGQLLKSEDGGGSFEVLYTSPTAGVRINSIVLNNLYGQILLGTSNGGILESRDNGKSWSVLRWMEGSVAKILLRSPNDSQYLVLNGNTKLWRMDIDGQNFKEIQLFSLKPSQLNNIFQSRQIYGVWFDEDTNSIIWAGTSVGLLRSVDSGSRWNVVQTLVPEKNSRIYAFAQDFSNPQIIYVGMNNKIYKSQDAGTHWSVLNFPAKSAMGAIKIYPRKSSIIFVTGGN